MSALITDWTAATRSALLSKRERGTYLRLGGVGLRLYGFGYRRGRYGAFLRLRGIHFARVWVATSRKKVTQMTSRAATAYKNQWGKMLEAQSRDRIIKSTE